jgi:hypothetical protein
MNIDDPKLTAFALDELDEPERSTIAQQVAESPEAQRAVDETRELARALRNGFAAELNEKPKPRLSLSDIRDDPWFWGIGRPLAIAAVLAIFAIIGGVAFWPRPNESDHRPGGAVFLPPAKSIDVQADFLPAPGPELRELPNPLSPNVIKRIEQVVIGEIGPGENSELRVIERIQDAYRIERLKETLRASVIAKKRNRETPGARYGLMFVDGAGRIVASAVFLFVPNQGYLLQPEKRAYERDGHYFMGGESTLPGDWINNVDYDAYAIPFPDWPECIGYAPGV